MAVMYNCYIRMEDTYNFGCGKVGLKEMQLVGGPPFEGVVRNHLARCSQQQNVTFVAGGGSSRLAVLAPWLQSQHKHLRNTESQAFVSFPSSRYIQCFLDY